jgi:protein gp37
MGTKIEWTDEAWNPVTGCSKVGAGRLLDGVLHDEYPEARA